MSTTHPIEAGALARIAKFTDEKDMPTLREGLEFIIEDYVDENDSEDGIPFYWGSRPGNMNDVVVRADAVEIVKTRAEMESRSIPTAAQIAEHIGGEALGFGNAEFRLGEADYSAMDGTLELFGRTSDGLAFSADIKVIRVTQVDE